MLLAVPFAACTNEDLMDTTVSSTPEEVLSKAVSLGDNFSIVGTKGISADTRAILGDDFATTWEETDTVGGAWYAIAPASPDPGAFIDASNKKLFSNHPFAFSKDLGEMKTVEFKANTNAFAGKYLLYYPYDHTVASVSPNIPIVFDRNPVMDCTEGKTMKHLSLFAWCDATFEKGGSQAGEFALKQAGNIAVIKVGAKDATIGNQIKGKKIQRIILESTGKLNDKGSIKVDDAKVDAYANYAGKYEANSIHADSYILTPTNAGTDYEVTGVGEAGMTKKAFYISMLPAESDIASLDVKVLMANGKVYKAAFVKSDASGSQVLDTKLFENIVQAQKKVTLNVLLSEEVKGSDVYTVEQFTAAMEAVDASPTTITLGADITLESLTFNKPGMTVNIQGGALTVTGDLKVVAGTLNTTTSVLTAKGNVNVAGDAATLTVDNAIEIGAVTVEGDGTATIKHATAGKVASAEVTTFGMLSLENVTVSGNLTIGRGTTATLSGVTLMGETVNNGDVTFSTAALTNKGTFTSTGKDNKVTVSYASTNEGIMSLEGTTLATSTALTNRGMLSLNGTTVTGTAGIANAAGGTLNVSGADATISKLTNAAASGTKKAGIVNIDMNEKATEVTADDFTNSGIVNINKGTLTESVANKVGMAGTGVMDIKAEGVLSLYTGTDGQNMLAGSVIKIVKDDNIAGSGDVNAIEGDIQAPEVTNAEGLTAALLVTKATTLILNAPDLALATGQNSPLQAKHLILKQSIKLFASEGLTMAKALDVDGDVTISMASGSATITLCDKTGANITNVINGSLTIASNVTLVGHGSGSLLKGHLINGGGTITPANIEIVY